MRYPQHNSRAFTMVEILSVIAILAVLLVAIIPIVSNYITQSRQTADKQTLLVLNDALNRYKTQGGDLAALTTGASLANVLDQLQQPITWAGVTHQFLGTATTYSASSLSSFGSAHQFIFTRYGSYTSGTEVANGISAALDGEGVSIDKDILNAWMIEAFEETGSSDYAYFINPSSTTEFEITGKLLNSSDSLYVWWGDGTTATYTPGNTSGFVISKTYGSSANRGIVMVGSLVSISSSYTDGRTNFGGNITNLTHLTGFSLGGYNTVGGSIDKMSNLSAIGYLGPSSQLSGDIANCLNFNYMSVASSSIGGDISQRTDTTLFAASANHTFRGKIDNLTNLRYFSCSSKKDLDYSTTNWNLFTDLSYFNVTELSTAQQDAVLAAFWANKDIPKTPAWSGYTYRRIDLRDETSNAPSATGITYRDNLIAEGWEVYTN